MNFPKKSTKDINIVVLLPLHKLLSLKMKIYCRKPIGNTL